jgi:hypothetical protein
LVGGSDDEAEQNVEHEVEAGKVATRQDDQTASEDDITGKLAKESGDVKLKLT